MPLHTHLLDPVGVAQNKAAGELGISGATAGHPVICNSASSLLLHILTT